MIPTILEEEEEAWKAFPVEDDEDTGMGRQDNERAGAGAGGEEWDKHTEEGLNKKRRERKQGGVWRWVIEQRDEGF